MISHVTRYIDLRDKNFFTVPKPIENELLSSWLIRVALAHDTLPWSFYNLHFPDLRNIIFSRDLDIWVNNDLLIRLSQKSNLSIEILFSMTLQSYADILQRKIVRNTGNTMISPVVPRARSNQKYGLRFCPLCLGDDLIPYFRKVWRVSFYSVCLKHSLLLLDRCCKCEKALSIYKFQDELGFIRCWYCGQDLSKCVSTFVADDKYLAIQKLSDIISNKKYNCVNQEVSALDFFTVYHQIVKILNLHSSSSNKMSPYDSLMSSVHFWEEFGNLLNGKNISAINQKSALTKDMVYIPFFYKNILYNF